MERSFGIQSAPTFVDADKHQKSGVIVYQNAKNENTPVCRGVRSFLGGSFSI